MSASSAEKTALTDFYNPNDPVINEQAKVILTKYSGISEDELVKHVHAVVSLKSLYEDGLG